MTTATDDQLARYLDYLATDPDNVELLTRTIGLCLDAHQPDQAKIFLDRAVALKPADPRLRFYAAVLHIAANDFNRAETLLTQLLTSGVDNPGVRYNLGLCQLHNHKPELAFESLQVFAEQTIEQFPHAKLLLARAMHHLGDLNAAQQQIEQHLNVHPDSGEALGYLALLLLDGDGDNDECLAVARAALQRDPDNCEALIVLGTLALERYDIAAAQPCFDRVLARNPNSGRAWLAKGIAALAAHDAAEGERLLQKTVAVMPAHLGTRVALGWAQIVQLKLDEAERTFIETIELRRTFGESHAGLAIVWIMQSRFSEAEAKVKLAKRLSPPDAISVQYAEALLAQVKGDASKARELAANLVNSPITAGSPTVREALLKLSGQGN